MSRIRAVQVWQVGFPLRVPIQLPGLTYTERDYCIVKVTDDEGATGVGYCLGRGAPISAAVMRLAPLVVDQDPYRSEALWTSMYRASIPYGQRGVALRALSLLDVALWDVRARKVGLPVHLMLGGNRSEVPVLAGGGYYRERRPADDVARELKQYVTAGFRLVKVPGGGLDPSAERAWVELARGAVGEDASLAVDAHWSWQDVYSALAVLRDWEPYHLAWVEDPLWPEATLSASALRSQARVPIAIGDEQSGRWAYQQLLEHSAADIWRVDVMTVGGFTEAMRIAAMASTWGIAISTHIYPEIHVHLAASQSSVLAIEYTAPETEIDLSHKFIRHPLEPVGGVAHAPTGPGLDIEIDWDLVGSQAREHYTLEAADGS